MRRHVCDAGSCGWGDDNVYHDPDYRVTLPPATWRWVTINGRYRYLCDAHYRCWQRQGYMTDRGLRPMEIYQYDETRRWFPWRRVQP